MTEERIGPPGRRFGPVPWLLGGAGFLVYLISLNWWVSLLNLGVVARVLDSSAPPLLGEPVTGALVLLFRLLPGSWTPPVMNLFAAICAAGVLVLLARSVALLPHTQAPDDPLRKTATAVPLALPAAWLPPVLAAAVCGLQLSFWEHATAFTGEMLDLLLFAYVIRCLLEFRLGQEQRWLSRCAFIYGVGMVNNWAFIGYFPVFLVTLLWLKGLGPFLERRFLLRMCLWGLAGLSFYLVGAALQTFAGSPHLGFWPALRAHLRFQKGALGILRNPTFRMLGLASVLPLLALAVRWKSHTIRFGDDSPLGVFLTKATGHFVHGLFLAASLWFALDPSFSPRHLGLGLPMLTFYYVSALVAGYCAGYLLLFDRVETRWPGNSPRRASTPTPGVRPSATVLKSYGWGAGLVLFLTCLMPLALTWRNVGQIRLTNGRFVREFAKQLYLGLPTGDSVVLSEESWQRLLLQVELSAHHPPKDALLLDTLALFSPAYQKSMAAKFKARWPVGDSTNGFVAVDTHGLQDLVSDLAARSPVFYLHPSSGLFLERFTARPQGALYQLVPRAALEGFAPKSGEVHALNDPRNSLDSKDVEATERYWNQRWGSSLAELSAGIVKTVRPANNWARPVLDFLRLEPEPNATASTLGAAYSKCLNYWGVREQRAGHWPAAGIWFQRTLELNPRNLAAQINAIYNQQCQNRNRARLDAAHVQQQFAELFADYTDWRAVLNDHGPVDEPTFLFRTARALETAAYPRQALSEFSRDAELAPDWPVPKLWVARCRLELDDFVGALEVTAQIETSTPPQTGAGWGDLLYYRIRALRGLGRTNDATACIGEFVGRHPEQPRVLSTAADLFEEAQDWEAELPLLEGWLKRDPDNAKVLGRKGFAELQVGRYDAAIATLGRALMLAPAEAGPRLHRATALFRADELEAAREDYELLLKMPGFVQSAKFGLGNIAWRRKDTNAAVAWYQQYLSNASPQSAQYTLAAQRLKQLRRE